MKRSIGKRITSVLLCLVLLVGLIPAVAPTAEAAQTGNWDNLRAALEDNTTRSIKLTEDFKGESTNEELNPGYDGTERYHTPFELE